MNQFTTPEKIFMATEEFKTWKRGIVRRRLERLDKLLSSGEWISNSRMIEEINELYLNAPNDDCYASVIVPHRIIESKERSHEEYISRLYFTYAGTVRQDRYAIRDILRMMGKEHILENQDSGIGTEGSYRYSTAYSIFEKYTINDIEFDDYELSNSVPIVLNTIQSELKTGETDDFLEKVAHNLEDLDFATTQSINLLSALAKAMQRARAINNNHISNLLDKVFAIYDTQKEGWEKDIIKNSFNAYIAASHPEADFDRGLLIYIRLLIIITKIIDGAEQDILDYLYEELDSLNKFETAEAYQDVKEFVIACIKYFVFEFSDYKGMSLELEKHYRLCTETKSIPEDYALMIAIHSFIYPEEWQYAEEMHSCLCNLIELYENSSTNTEYVRWMQLLFICLKQYMEAAKGGSPKSSFSSWSMHKFELISSIKPDSIAKIVSTNAPEDDLHEMLHIGDLEDQARFVEYMIITDMRFDMSDILKSIIEQDGKYLEFMPTEKAIQIFEELLSRYERLNDIFDVPENSGRYACKQALALLHDSLKHKKEALFYYSSIEKMLRDNEIESNTGFLQQVQKRISILNKR